MRQLVLGLLFIISTYGSQVIAAMPTTITTTESAEKWGGANPEDIKAVLDSVITALAPVIEPRQLGTIIVQSTDENPISIYEKGKNGEHYIQLNVKGNYWSQLIYQFSHELCHVLSNNELAPNNSTHQQWFEESLCEAFSIMTLGKTAELWKTNPPYPQWQGYSEKLSEYQQDLINKPERKLPEETKLPEWYLEHKAQMEQDPYADNRTLNNIVANQLYNIFQSEPNSWSSIKAINLGADQTDISLDQFLLDWQTNANLEQKRVVAKIRALFLNN